MKTSGQFFQSPMPSDVNGGRTTKGRLRQNESGLRMQALFPTPKWTDGVHPGRVKVKPGQQVHLSTELNKLTSSLVDSHASPSATQENERALAIRVGSGRKCLWLYELSRPAGSWQRMFMDSLLTTVEAYSTRFTTTWRAQTTKRSRRLFFQLAPSERRTAGIESGLWPTPQNHDGAGPRRKGNTFSDNHHYPHDLATAIQYPTMTARDSRSFKGNVPPPNHQGAESLTQQIGGQLNPTFVEWLMGYPGNWTLIAGETENGQESPASQRA